MKKTLKRTLLAIGIIIIGIILFFGGYMIKVKSELKTLTPIETKHIVDNIYTIQDTYSNLYLIEDSSQYIAIDGGNDINIISEELKKLNINPDKITAILLTHSDRDHIAAVKLFKNAEVYISEQEEQLIDGRTSRFLFFGNDIGTKEYSLITDQQTFAIGNVKIKGILVPGHTPGSMCFLVDDKYLFTGDVLSIKDGKIDKFNDLFNMDTKMTVKSMVKITKIPDAEYIFSAHYGYTNNYKNAVKDWDNKK